MELDNVVNSMRNQFNSLEQEVQQQRAIQEQKNRQFNVDMAQYQRALDADTTSGIDEFNKGENLINKLVTSGLEGTALDDVISKTPELAKLYPDALSRMALIDTINKRREHMGTTGNANPNNYRVDYTDNEDNNRFLRYGASAVKGFEGVFRSIGSSAYYGTKERGLRDEIAKTPKEVIDLNKKLEFNENLDGRIRALTDSIGMSDGIDISEKQNQLNVLNQLKEKYALTPEEENLMGSEAYNRDIENKYQLAKTTLAKQKFTGGTFLSNLSDEFVNDMDNYDNYLNNVDDEYLKQIYRDLGENPELFDNWGYTWDSMKNMFSQNLGSMPKFLDFAGAMVPWALISFGTGGAGALAKAGYSATMLGTDAFGRYQEFVNAQYEKDPYNAPQELRAISMAVASTVADFMGAKLTLEPAGKKLLRMAIFGKLQTPLKEAERIAMETGLNGVKGNGNILHSLARQRALASGNDELAELATRRLSDNIRRAERANQSLLGKTPGVLLDGTINTAKAIGKGVSTIADKSGLSLTQALKAGVNLGTENILSNTASQYGRGVDLANLDKESILESAVIGLAGGAMFNPVSSAVQTAKAKYVDPIFKKYEKFAPYTDKQQNGILADLTSGKIKDPMAIQALEDTATGSIKGINTLLKEQGNKVVEKVNSKNSNAKLSMSEEGRIEVSGTVDEGSMAKINAFNSEVDKTLEIKKKHQDILDKLAETEATRSGEVLKNNNEQENSIFESNELQKTYNKSSEENKRKYAAHVIGLENNDANKEAIDKAKEAIDKVTTSESSQDVDKAIDNLGLSKETTETLDKMKINKITVSGLVTKDKEVEKTLNDKTIEYDGFKASVENSTSLTKKEKGNLLKAIDVDSFNASRKTKEKAIETAINEELAEKYADSTPNEQEAIGTLLNNSNATDADIDELAGLNKASTSVDALKARDLSDKIKESQKTIEDKKKAITDEFDKIGVAKSFDTEEQAKKALKDLEEGTPSGLNKFNPFYSKQALKGRYKVVVSEHVNKGKYYIVDNGLVKEAETIREAIDTAIKAKDHAKIKEKLSDLVDKYGKLGVSKRHIDLLKNPVEHKGDFSDEYLTTIKGSLSLIENSLKEEKEEYVKKLGNSGVINRYNKLSKSRELANNRGREKLIKSIKEKIKKQRDDLAKLFPILKGLVDNPHNANAIKNVLKSLGEINVEINGTTKPLYEVLTDINSTVSKLPPNFTLQDLDTAIQGLSIKLPKDFVALCNTAVSAINSVGNVTEEIANFRNTFMVLGRVAEQSSTTNSNTSELASTEGNTFNSTKENNAILSSFAELKNTVIASGVLDIQQYRSNTVNSVIEALGVRISNASTSVQDIVDNWVSATVNDAYNNIDGKAVDVGNLYGLLDLTYEKNGIRRVIDDIADEIENSSGSILNKQLANAIRNVHSEDELKEFLKESTNKATLLQAVIKSKTMLKIASYYSKQGANNVTPDLANIDKDKFRRDFYKADTSTPLTVGVTQENVYNSLETFFKHIFPGKLGYDSYMAIMMGNNKGGSDGIPDTMVSAFISALGYKELLDYSNTILSSINSNGKLKLLATYFNDISKVLSSYNGKVPTYTDLTTALKTANQAITNDMVKLVADNFGALSFCIQLKSLLPKPSQGQSAYTIADIIGIISTSNFKDQSNNLDALYSNRNTKVYKYDTYTVDEGKEAYTLDDVNKRLDILRSSTTNTLTKSDIENSELSETIKSLLLEKLNNKTNPYTNLDQDSLNKIGNFYTSFINSNNVNNDITTTATTTATTTPKTYSGGANILGKYVTAKNKKFLNVKRKGGLSGNSIQTIKLQNENEDLDNILDEIIKITNGLYDFTGEPAILVDLFGKNPIDGKFRLPPELASAIATTAYVYLDRLSSESSEDFLTKINTQFPGLGSVFTSKNLMDRANLTQTLGMAIYQQFFKGKMPDGMKNTLIAELGTYAIIALEDLGAVKIQKLDTKTKELKGTNYSGKNPLLNVVSIQETKLNNLREKKEKLDYSGSKGRQNHLADLLDTDFVKPTVMTATEYTAQQTDLSKDFGTPTTIEHNYTYGGEDAVTGVGFTTQYSDDGEICKVTINNPDGSTKKLEVYLSGDQVTSIDGTRVSPYKLFSIATNVGLGYPVEVTEMKEVYTYLFNGITPLPTASQIANIFNDGYEYWANDPDLKNRLLEYVGYEEPKVSGTTLNNERTKYINLIKQLVIDMGYVNSMNSTSSTEVVHLRYSSTINNRGIVLSDVLNMRENKLNRPFLDLYKNGNAEIDIADDSFEVTDDSRLLMKGAILLNTVDDGVDKKTRDEIDATYKEFLEVAKNAYIQYMSVPDFITAFNNNLPTDTKLSKLKYTPTTYRAIKYLLYVSDSGSSFGFHDVDVLKDNDIIYNWRIPLEIDGLTNGQGIKAMMGITLSSTSTKSLNQLLAVGVSEDRTYFREKSGSNDTYQLNGVFVKREILRESLERFLGTGIDNQEALSALATCFGLDSSTPFDELVNAVFSRSFMKAPTMVTGYGSGKKALIVRITEEFQKKISELFYEASRGNVDKLTSWFNSMNALNNGNGVTISFDGKSATFKSIDALLKAHPANDGLWLKADFLFSENSFLSNRFTSSTIEPMFNGIKTALEETSTLDSSLSETSEVLGTTISNMINDKVNEYINKGGDYNQAELIDIISNEIDAILDVFPSTLVINGLGDELNLIKKDIKNGVLSLCDNILVKASSTLKGKKRSSDGASGYIAYKGGISNYTGIASATVPEITHTFDSQIIHITQNALFAQKSLFLGVHDAGELTPRAGLAFGKEINKAYWQSTIRSYDVVKGTISMLTNLESQILAKGGNTKTLGDIRKAIDTNNKLLIKLYSDKLAYLKSDKKLNINQYSSWDISNYEPTDVDKQAEIDRINNDLGTIYANEDINGFITYIKLFKPGLDDFYKKGDNRFDKAFKPAILDLLNKSKDVDSFLAYMVSNNFIDANKAADLKVDFVKYKEKLMSSNVSASLLVEITKDTEKNDKDALSTYLSSNNNSSLDKAMLISALKNTLLGLYDNDSNEYYKLVSNANNIIIDRITQAIINSSNTLPSDPQAFTLSILQECVSGSTLEQRTVFARLFNKQVSKMDMRNISFNVDSALNGKIVVGDLFPEVDYRALENQFKQEASTSYFLDKTNNPIDNYTDKLDAFIKKAYGDLTDKDQVVFDLNNKQQLLALARIQALQSTRLLKGFKVVVIPAISDSPTMRSLKDISTGIAGALRIAHSSRVQIRTSLSPTKGNNKGFVSMVVGTAFNDAFVSNDIHTPNESIRTPTNTTTKDVDQEKSLVKYSTFVNKENKVFKLDEFGYDRGDVGTTDYKSYNQLDLRTSPLGRNNNFTFYTPTATGTYNNLDFESTDAPDVSKFTDNTEALLNDGYFVVPTNSSGEVLVRGFEALAKNNKELTEVMSIYRNAVKVREENLRTNKSTIEEYETPIIVETKPDKLGNIRKFIFQVTVSNTVDAKGFSGLLTTMQSTGVSTSHTIINATNPFAQRYLDESKFNDSSYLAKVRVFFNKNKSAIESISGAAKYITIPTELLKPELREEGAKSLESADINEQQISELLDSGNVCILTNATESALANVTSTTARGDSYTTRRTLHSSNATTHRINYLTFNNFDATHAKSVTESWARKTRNLLGTQLNKLGNRVLNRYNSLSPTQANEYRRMTKHSLMDSINQAKALDAMNGEDNSHSDWLDIYLEKTNMIVNLGSMESMVPGGSEELIWNAKDKAVYITHSVSKNASNNTTVLKHELVHGIWESSTNDATAVHQATQLFQYVAKNITVDDLIAIGCSEARAKEMLNYIFGSDSTVNHLAEFMAYIATEKDFQLAIQNLQQRNNLKTDITTRTRGIISRAWSKLFGLKAEYTTKSEVPKDIVKASRKIFERVFDASQKMWEDPTSISRGNLSKKQTDELGGDYLSGLMSEVLGVNQTNRVLSKMLDGSAEDTIVGVTSFIRKHMSKTKTDFADQLATSLEGVSKKSWDYIKLRLKCKQEIDAARQMASNSISNKIEDIISGLPAKVVNQLPTQFIKLDISCLRQYDDNYVNLLTDKETRNKAIAELENTLRSNQFGNFYINASKGLANYLITGHNNSGIGYRNAYEIASMGGSQYTHYLSHTDPLISSIDALTTLYGINILESTQKLVYKKIEPTVIKELVDIHNNIKDFEFSNVYKNSNQKLHIPKGQYSGGTSYGEYKVYLGDSKEAIKWSSPSSMNETKLDPLGAKIANGKQYLTVHHNFRLPVSREAGIFALTDVFNGRLGKGTRISSDTTDEANLDPQQLTEISSYLTNTIKRLNTTKPALMDETDGITIPTFGITGKLSGARFELNPEVARVKTHTSTKFSNIMGDLYGSAVERIASPETNAKLGQAVLDLYEANKTKKDKKYVWVNEESTNEDIREYYKMIPYEVKDLFEKRYPSKGVPIEQDALNLVLPRKATTSKVIDHDYYKAIEEGVATINQRLRHIFRNGGINKLEDVANILTRAGKENLVIKGISVSMGNLISNNLLLSKHGMSPVKCIKDQIEGMHQVFELNNYLRKLQELKLKELAHTATRDDMKEINAINNSIKALPIYPLYEYGALGTIADDLGNSDTFVKDTISKYAPTILQNALHNLAVDQKSVMYNILREFATLPDKAGKYALYKNLSKNLTTDERIRICVGEFIDYGIPLPKGMDYVEAIGLSNFLKYPMGIQSVMHRLSVDNAKSVIPWLIGQGSLGVNLPDTYDSLLGLNTMSRGLNVPGLGIYFDSVTQLFSYKVANSLFGN